MSKIITPVANSSSFEDWVSATNTLINVAAKTVTLESNTVGDTSTGNGYVNGVFGAANLIAGTSLRGGTVDTPAALTISSNVNFSGTINATANVKIVSSNIVLAGNSISNVVTITANSTSSDLVIGGNNAILNANVTANGNLTLPSGNTTQRPTGAKALVRYNTDTDEIEYYSNTWNSLAILPITAANVIFSNNANIASNNVQDAIVETWNEKVSLAGDSMTGMLGINLNGSSFPTSPSGTLLRLIQADSTVTRAILESVGASSSVVGRRASGTSSIKTALVSNDQILEISGYGYYGNAYVASEKVSITFLSSETWSLANNGTYIKFSTTPSGSNALVTSLLLYSNTLTVNTNYMNVNGNTLANNVSINGTLTSNTTNLTGVTTAGSLTLSGNLVSNTNVTFNGDTVANNLTVTGNFAANSTLSFTGSVLANTVTAMNTMTANADMIINGATTANVVTVKGTLLVNGVETVNNSININGATTANTVTAKGAFVANSTATINGTLTANVVTITGATTANSMTLSGILTGTSGKFSSDLSTNTTFTANGTATFNANLVTSTLSNAILNGPVVANNSLTVTGTTTANAVTATSLSVGGYPVWTSGNDGSGSGLDADTLDGNDSSVFAKLASPALTGVPTAPTAVNATSTTQLATTAFVQNVLSATYTASDILTKLKTVDGTGSGLDADTVDGLHSSSFATSTQGTKADNALPSSSYTASDVLTKIKTVDGSGSGLDADTLDGHDSSYFYSSGNPPATSKNFGEGQTLQSVALANNTIYHNTSGQPIGIILIATSGGSSGTSAQCSIAISSDNITYVSIKGAFSSGPTASSSQSGNFNSMAIIPTNFYYKVSIFISDGSSFVSFYQVK